MGNRNFPRRFLFDLPSLIRVAQRDDPWIKRRHSEEATWNLLIYLRDEKDEADPTAIQFLHESYCGLTESQWQKLWRAIHAKRGRPRRKPDHENTAFGDNETNDSNEPDIEMLVAGLCRLTGSQLRWLAKVITSRIGRPSQSITRHNRLIKNGARAHQLIEERREVRKGQRHTTTW